MTVSAADDDDGIDGAATFTHSASGADYGSVVIASVKATESDNDTPGVTVNPEALPVTEGSTATYTVALDTQPSVDVTVSLSASGDSDLTVSTTALTFTTADWDTAQTVTVTAADDDDAADGQTTIAHAAASTDSGYHGITIASVMATEDDNDTVGVTVDPETLSVTEESTATYTVVLDTLPTGAVMVTVAKTAGGDPHLTTSPAALTFTTGNWDTAQTVTVSASDDGDSVNGTATFTHSASGADYGSVVIASVMATESDNDTPGVTVTPPMLPVTEGATATYTVVLTTQPSAAVTVSASASGDGDLTVAPSALTFSTSDWSTAQTVTVTAADDDDAANGEATIAHSASGGGYASVSIASVTATEADNDTAGVTVSPTELSSVNENGSATYTVVLDTRPAGTVRVAVGKADGGDPSLTRSPTSLTFTVSNWSTPKTVTVRAADDADSTNGTATFTHTATSTADSDYNAIIIASVEATEADDDMPGLKLSRTSVTVSEGRSATYTVALNTLPTGSVTVAVTASGDSDLTAAPTSLTFTTTDWSRAQTVTVSAADDGDAEDGTATFANTPSGADYASVTGAVVTATEDDNDTAGVTVSPTRLTVNETGSATYTVVLDTLPTAAVTVGVAASGDSDLTVSTAALTFTTGNWNTAQTVTVSAADDVDPDHGTATIAHTASGASEYADVIIASVTATEADDDTPGLNVSTNTLTVTEGGSATYTVVLNTLPPGNVTVTVSRTGDSDLTVSPTRLTFTTDNWNTARTATVSAAEDDDAADGAATIRNRASGSGYGGLTAELTATEDDDDTAGVTVTPTELTVNEAGSATYTVVLDTRPAGTVRVAVGKADGGDRLTRSPTSLTFTVSNWSRPKTVTVRAADDADSTNGTAIFTHTATSTADSDYDAIIIASVEATESDDDMPGLKLSRTSVTVSEGRSATYTVALNTLPTGSVTVAVAASGDSDGDLTAAPTSLTFTTTDWNRAQTVTVSAADDGDAEDGTATFANTPSGADYASVTGAVVTATEDDDDTAGVTVSPTRLTVNENGSETYTVVLDTLPTAAVTVTPAATGDAHIGVSGALTFTTANWNTVQTVTVSAADDDDPDHGKATIAHTASGAGEYADVAIASVTATEADDDTPGLKLSTTALTVAEGGSANYTVALNTLPPGNVTVTLSRRTGDRDLTVSPTRLTFTTDNWEHGADGDGERGGRRRRGRRHGDHPEPRQRQRLQRAEGRADGDGGRRRHGGGDGDSDGVVVGERGRQRDVHGGAGHAGRPARCGWRWRSSPAATRA